MLTALDYVAAGFVLVPIPAGLKGPTGEASKGWSTREACMTSAEAAQAWQGNLGLAHAYSGTCAVDIDDVDEARRVLAGHSIDLDALLDDPRAVRIDSGRTGRAKLIYRVDTPLRSRKFGKAFELRCASREGTTLQDVLPPSIHPDTGLPYRWVYNELLTTPLDPPAIPEALLQLWVAENERRESAVAPGPAGQGSYPQLQQLLVGLDPDAVYDSDTSLSWIKVGMALHHETNGSEQGLALWDAWSSKGVKYRGLDDLRKHWVSFKAGQGVTIEYLRARQPASADEFDVIEPPHRRFAVLGANEFSTRAPANWWIKGLLPQAELGVLFGASGSGKTFLLTDLLLAVARGQAWRGHRVRPGRVVFVVAEGQHGFQLRLRAYAHEHQVDLSKAPVGVIADVPNFLQADHLTIIEEVKAWGGADIVAVDTLAAVMPGGDENSGEAMGAIISRCKRIHAATGALVLLVHHAGKDSTKGARGWSGLKAAADVELEVERLGDHERAVRVSKLKDGEDGQVYGFRLRPVLLGEDADGDELTSCIVEATETATKSVNVRPVLGRVESIVLGAAREVAAVDQNEVEVEAVLGAASALMPVDSAKRDRRREHILRAIEQLVARGVVVVKNNKLQF